MSFFLPQLSIPFRTDFAITILTMASFLLSQLKTLRMALINISGEMLAKNENNPKFNFTFLVFFIVDYPLLLKGKLHVIPPSHSLKILHRGLQIICTLLTLISLYRYFLFINTLMFTNVSACFTFAAVV